MTEPIPIFATARKCSVCQHPAKFWNFKSGKLGGIDRSSRTPRCEEHKETQ